MTWLLLFVHSKSQSIGTHPHPAVIFLDIDAITGRLHQIYNWILFPCIALLSLMLPSIMIRFMCNIYVLQLKAEEVKNFVYRPLKRGRYITWVGRQSASTRSILFRIHRDFKSGRLSKDYERASLTKSLLTLLNAIPGTLYSPRRLLYERLPS